jgi:8-oxo-dGTP pyrophosphatase MutT (NUDIX family)
MGRVIDAVKRVVGKGQPTSSDVHVNAPLGSRRRLKKNDVDNTDTDPPLNNLEAEFIHAAIGRKTMDAPQPFGAEPDDDDEQDDDDVEKRRHNIDDDEDEDLEDDEDYDDIEKASPRRVASVAVMHGDHLLMGKRRDNGKWTMPGGHVDDGEDFHSGALRELLEEAGIETDRLDALTDVNEKTDKAGLPLHVQGFGLDLTDDDRPPTTMQGDPDGEVHRWQWVNTADGLPDDIAENMHVPPEHNILMHALGLAEPVEKDDAPDGSWLHDYQNLVSGMDYEAEDAGDNDHDTHRAIAAANLAEDPDHYKDARAEDGEDVGDGLNLDLGSGQARQSGYLGVDTYKFDHGTIVHDLTCGLPFPDGCASNVRMVNALHTVDHGGDIKPLLSEIQRVLMPGGQFYYEGPSDISNDAGQLEGLADVTPEEVGKDAAGDNSDTGFPEGDNDTRWHYHVFSRLANPDAAASDDAQPRIGLAAQDNLGSDTLLASDVDSYYSEDSTTTGAGNRRHGYPSQGALVAKGGPGSGPHPGEGGEGKKPKEKKDPATMSVGELKKEYASLHEKQSKNTSAQIEAGFGTMRPSDMRQQQPNHPLTKEMDAISDRMFAIRHEAERRGGPGFSVDQLTRIHKPIGKSAYIAKSLTGEGFQTTKFCPIFKAVASQQIVYCVVLTPDEADEQDDFMDADEIEKTAHEYLLKSRVIGSNHTKAIQAAPVESYIAPCDFDGNGQYGPQTVKKGSWCIGIKVFDKDEWKKVEKGEYQGVSVGGLGLRDRMN